VDSYNPSLKWFDTDVVGIDQGITLLSAENLLTGDVWHWFMANPVMQRAMDLAGFSPLPAPAPEPVAKKGSAKRKSAHKASRSVTSN
jgi:hypothetical protein